jgi:hypothetical protein
MLNATFRPQQCMTRCTLTLKRLVLLSDASSWTCRGPSCTQHVPIKPGLQSYLICLQSYLIFRAELATPHSFAPGPESQEVALFAPEDIPFDSIAFSSIHLTLVQWIDDKKRGQYSCRHGVIRKKAGASPRDPNASSLTDCFHTHLGAPA